jgi:hypothetical protein
VGVEEALATAKPTTARAEMTWDACILRRIVE